jgi:hypothetical protein
MPPTQRGSFGMWSEELGSPCLRFRFAGEHGSHIKAFFTLGHGTRRSMIRRGNLWGRSVRFSHDAYSNTLG